MVRYNKYMELIEESGLASIFKVRQEEIKQDHVVYRVVSNMYRIKSFEIWKHKDGDKLRVFYNEKINEDLKNAFMELECINRGDAKKYVDYKEEDYLPLLITIKGILENDDIIKKCIESKPRARTGRFEGLDLPDIDISQTTAIGKVFNWREIIAIWEDDSEENLMKKELQQNGIYIQRSKDGTSRYIGSAYGQEGVIGRWIHHLNNNGDANHLNLFVLENGYNEIEFSVIEFLDDEENILKKESQWKTTLGTLNYGPYNGLQLNRN